MPEPTVPVPQRLRILTLAGKWAGGGPYTVNRELSIALAELGHHVTARVGVPSPKHPLVTVQVLEPVPGLTDPEAQLLRADGLPRKVDVIIGHGRFSGGAASYLRDHFYPRAKVVHVVHVTTDEMDRLRGDPVQSNRHTETERALIGRADLVIGVGPLLTDDAARLARMCDPTPPVAQLLPGVVLGTPPVYNDQQQRLNLLVFTRTDDQLKGADVAAAAARELRARGLDIRLTMLGDRSGSLVEQERALSDIAGMPVRVRAFSADRKFVEAEIRGADLVVHSAVHEDFGLAPLEAAGFGVPVVVGGHTGVGKFLADPRRVPPELGRPSVVDVPSGTGPAVATAWADRIQSVLADLPTARNRALRLREYLGTHYTWQHAAGTLTDRLREVPTRGIGRTPGPGYRPGPLPSVAARSALPPQPSRPTGRVPGR